MEFFLKLQRNARQMKEVAATATAGSQSADATSGPAIDAEPKISNAHDDDDAEIIETVEPEELGIAIPHNFAGIFKSGRFKPSKISLSRAFHFHRGSETS